MDFLSQSGSQEQTTFENNELQEKERKKYFL